MELKGCTALITGGGRRLGAACALALGKEGIQVIVHYNRSQAEAEQICQHIRANGGKADAIQADLADWSQAAGLIPKIRERFGPFSILLNNASVFNPGRIATTDQALWQEEMAINLNAPFLLIQNFAQQEPVKGKIVNMLDYRVLKPKPGHLAYTIAKSALWTLTRLAALELAPHIQVNAIGPGAILPTSQSDPGELARIAAATPMAVPGKPQDIIEALLFFLKQDYITGELLCIDGGAHL